MNLERPLRVGDELGGHIVAGHVDGVGEVVAVAPEHGSSRWLFRVPEPLARFIAPKGSVAIDGVSLTVNEVRGRQLRRQHHSAHRRGDHLRPTATRATRVNIEIDTVARYVARLQEWR